MATWTTAALGCSLLTLYILTKATGQPLTVALLGVATAATNLGGRERMKVPSPTPS